MAVAKTGKVLVVANFGSAGVPPTVVSFPILPDGKLGDPVSNLAEAGVADGPPVQRDANGLSRPTPTITALCARRQSVRAGEQPGPEPDLRLSRESGHRVDGVERRALQGSRPVRRPIPASPPDFSADGRFVYILDGDMGIVTAAYDAVHGTLKAIQTLP